MAYENIPDGYQPEYVTARAETMERMLQALSRPQDEDNAERYIQMNLQSEEEHANSLLKVAIEQTTSRSQANKAHFMVQVARHVSDQERVGLTRDNRHSFARQVQVDLGLQYLAEEPAVFLAALQGPEEPRPEQLSLLGVLINLSPIARASYLRTLPAPAALAAIGAVNAAAAILDLERAGPPEDQQAVPFLMDIANSWLQIGAHLAAPDLPPPPPEAAGSGESPPPAWPPPWLDFLKDREL